MCVCKVSPVSNMHLQLQRNLTSVLHICACVCLWLTKFAGTRHQHPAAHTQQMCSWIVWALHVSEHALENASRRMTMQRRIEWVASQHPLRQCERLTINSHDGAHTFCYQHQVPYVNSGVGMGTAVFRLFVARQRQTSVVGTKTDFTTHTLHKARARFFVCMCVCVVRIAFADSLSGWAYVFVTFMKNGVLFEHTYGGSQARIAETCDCFIFLRWIDSWFTFHEFVTLLRRENRMAYGSLRCRYAATIDVKTPIECAWIIQKFNCFVTQTDCAQTFCSTFARTKQQS